MYTVHQQKRMTDEEFKEAQRANWEAKKAEYNKQRRERRQEALADMKKQGFPIVEDKDGVLHMDIRCGRKKMPALASAVPLSMIQPVSIDDTILLGDPEFLRHVKDAIPVPEVKDAGFDLQAFFGVKELRIVKNAPKWGMFYFKTWDELAPATRDSYVGSARLALKNDVVDYLGEHPALAQRYFYFDPEQDKWLIEVEERTAKLNAKIEALAGLGADELDAAREEVKKAADELKALEDKGAGEEDVIKVPEGRKRVGGAQKDKSGNFTRNPLRIVQFMVDANIDPWKLVLGWCETKLANSRASGLASCCFAYLRNMYSKKQHKNSVIFNKVLEWSFIFEKFDNINDLVCHNHVARSVHGDGARIGEERGRADPIGGAQCGA